MIRCLRDLREARMRGSDVRSGGTSSARFSGRFGDVKSHRRSEAILAIVDTRSLQRPIGLLFGRNDEDLDPWLEVALVTGRKGDNRGIGRDDNLLLSILVFKRQRLPVDPRHSLFDVGVGHRALWPNIPRIVAFAGAAHRFREYEHLDRLLASVGLRHAGYAD